MRDGLRGLIQGAWQQRPGGHSAPAAASAARLPCGVSAEAYTVMHMAPAEHALVLDSKAGQQCLFQHPRAVTFEGRQMASSMHEVGSCWVRGIVHMPKQPPDRPQELSLTWQYLILCCAWSRSHQSSAHMQGHRPSVEWLSVVSTAQSARNWAGHARGAVQNGKA